jgi:hypothetical protein
MSLYKFESEDVLFNRIETNPRVKFVLHTSSVIYNDNVDEFGIPNGNIALSELSTLKANGADTHQFITKDGTRVGWKTITLSSFNSLQFGDLMTASLPMTASIQNQYFELNALRPHVDALENISNLYTPLSNNYAYSSSLGDKATQAMRLFSIPSIFYGASIKKGTVDLKFYVTGTLIGRLQDKYRNGNLIQTEPYGSTGSGSVGGVAYYNEGFLMLTGSWDITTEHSEDYIGGGLVNPKWIYFGAEGASDTDTEMSSYEMDMSGTQYLPVITMLAHANKADLNHSNNPTYIEYGQTIGTTNPYRVDTGSLGFYERSNFKIKNVAKYMYNSDTGSFRKETYISKIGIYDDQKNLIGIAKVATPVRKRENDQFTFKLKLDI